MKVKIDHLKIIKGAVLGFVILPLALALHNNGFAVFAEDVSNSTPPSFPSCLSKSPPGDRAHYDYGWHQIPGNGLVEGSDDVYTLSDSNFLQCYCPVDGTDGVQTDWWKFGELSQEQIDAFINSGWILEVNGSDWNLFPGPYLAKNIAYYCGEEFTPTPTPTSTPTPTPTPTPTSTPTPTPTPGEEPESRCVSLSVSPSEGTAPLTVKFTGSGFDESGDIKSYKFDFGDSSGSQPQVWEQDGSEAAHRYENPGTYTAGLHVKDSRGNWRNGNNDCKKTIKVTEKPEVLGKKTVIELPKTGGPAGIGVILVTLGSIGAYLYKRFKLV